jgi:hypothetical protein
MVDWKGRMSNIPRTKHEEPIHVPLNDVAVASFGVVQVEALGQGVCFQSVIQAKPEWESRDGVSCGTDSKRLGEIADSTGVVKLCDDETVCRSGSEQKLRRVVPRLRASTATATRKTARSRPRRELVCCD